MAHDRNNTQFLCLAVAFLFMSVFLSSCNAEGNFASVYELVEISITIQDNGYYPDRYCVEEWSCSKPVGDDDQLRCRNFCVSKGYNFLRSYCEHDPYPECCCHK